MYILKKIRNFVAKLFVRRIKLKLQFVAEFGLKQKRNFNQKDKYTLAEKLKLVQFAKSEKILKNDTSNH